MSNKILMIVWYILFISSTISLYSEDNSYKSQFQILENDRLYSLVGDWKLSHAKDEKFILNEYDDTSWDSFPVPSIWMNWSRKEVFGWYRVHIFIGNSLRDIDLGFIAPNFLEASEIYFNGSLVGKLGEINKNGKLVKNNPRLDYFEIDKKLVRYNSDNVISVKVANFYGGMGGTQNLTYFGNLELCKKAFNRHLIFYSSFALGMIGLGFYHLVIFFKLRKDKTYLYYAGIVFSIALFVVTVYKLNYWFIESFFLQFVLFTSSIVFGGISVYLFIFSFFDYKIGKITKIIFLFYFGLVFLEVMPIFFPSLFVLRNMYLIKIHTLVNILYIFTAIGVLAKACIEKEAGWNVIIVGAIISFPLFVWDSLKATEILPQNNWFIIENCLIITITFAVALSNKYSKEYEKLLEVEREYAKDLQNEVEDKTENLMKANEELQKANKLKNKIFSIISQGLKMPLDTLDEVIHLFKNEKQSHKDLRKYFASLNDSLKRNRFLLENLLNWSYSQLEEKGEIQLAKIEIASILEEAIAFFLPEAKRKSIEILSFLKPGIFVFGNRNVLRLVFINILSNSIKFTPRQGSILIEMKGHTTGVIVTVSDSGVGLSRDLLELILVKNELISTLGTENENGTGLGLKISKDFIEKIGGTLFIESEIGVGTRVRVQLRAYEYE